MRNVVTKVVGVALGAVLLATGVARAQERAVPDAAPRLDRVDFRELPLGEACRLLSDQTGINVVPSADASQRTVSLFLSNVTAMEAIEALCRAHELWFQRDAATGIVRISTVTEFNRDPLSFQEEKTEFFTLLYPNALDVGYAIRNLFGTRVVLRSSDGDRDILTDLANRFSRFDLLDSRTQGIGGSSVTQGGGTGGARLGGGFVTGDATTSQGLTGGQGVAPGTQPDVDPATTERPRVDATADEILDLQRILGTTEVNEAQRAAVLEVLARRRRAPINVTVARRQNKLIVRTGDDQAMAQIRTVVRRLDVPTALVLLEVRVLTIDLLDGLTSFFEYQWAHEETAGSFSLGNILNPVPPALGPAGTGLRAGDMIFQYIDSRFAVRMQLLEQRNRVKVLATPVLLTANNEVCRLFVGREVPLNRSFSGGQVVANQLNAVTTAGTTGIEFRPVGTTLLITPNINADRTVTLRIVQESSDTNSTATVLVPSGTGFAPQTVNVVSSQSVSGTIVAKSDLAVAFGGLIETGTTIEREQVPILGDLPIVGFFFRRYVERETRRETVIVVRPYVLTTPAESEAVSQHLLDKLGSDTRRLDLRASSDSEHAEPAPAAERAPFRIHGIDRED